MTPNRIAIATLCAGLAFPGTSSAGLVTWELEGKIAQVSVGGLFDQGTPVGELPHQLDAVGVSSGVGWRARITFDTETPGILQDDGTDSTTFDGATKRIEFVAGGFSAVTPDGAVGGAGVASLGAASFYSSALSFWAPMANDSSVLVADSASLWFHSEDATRPLLASLPSEPPDPAVFTYWFNPYSVTISRFGMIGHGFVPDDDPLNPNLVEIPFSIGGSITSITRVPEPSLPAMILVASALITLRRRSRALP